MSEEICKNCKYHYMEEISFDYPQSCCNKTNPNHTTEEWLHCDCFEYSKNYITNLQQKVEQKDKEIDRLNKEYERIYNENCKLRENHNINDITLLDENERLNRIIDNMFKFMQNKYDNSDLTGFTISFMELQDLKALKEE